MNTRRIHIFMICITGTCVIGIFASLFLAQNYLRKKSDRLVSVKLENRVLEEQLNSLGVAKKTLEKYDQLNDIAKAIVPQEKDQARTIREISKLASDSGIKLSNISFPTSSLGQSGAKNQPLTQTRSVNGIPGLFVMEITVQQDPANPTTYAKFIDFLNKLENNRRTAQVTSVTIQPLAQNRDKLTFSLILNTYIKP